MKFNVGDIVVIKEDYDIATKNETTSFNAYMKKYFGKTAKVTAVFTVCEDCKLDIDNGDWFWSYDGLDKVDSELKVKHRIGDTIKIRDDLHNNKYYDLPDNNKLYCSDDMKTYAGRRAVITGYTMSTYANTADAYFIDIDDGCWSWSDSMLDDYEDNVIESDEKYIEQCNKKIEKDLEYFWRDFAKYDLNTFVKFCVATYDMSIRDIAKVLDMDRDILAKAILY